MSDSKKIKKVFGNYGESYYINNIYIKVKIMIKKFEQFTNARLNEMKGQYGNLDRSFIEEYTELSKDCLMTNIDIVKHLGGQIDVSSVGLYPETILIYKNSGNKHGIMNLERVNIDSFIVKQNSESDFPVLDIDKNEDGEYLVAIDTNGNEINIGVETCPEFHFFSINDLLTSYL